MHGIEEVLGFWFHEDTRRFWFQAPPAFDQTIRKRFAELFARAATGDLTSWEASAQGCLALCILLDQMPRSMFRGDRQAFGADDKALAIAERAIARGFDRELPPDQKQFLYTPFMRSEELSNQLRAFALFEAAGLREGSKQVEQRMAIIRRFGRFPHRNVALGRPGTAEEIEFLAQAGETNGRTSSPGPARGRSTAPKLGAEPPPPTADDLSAASAELGQGARPRV